MFVAIPSYCRHDILVKRSLPLCISWGIPQDAVYVFVVREQEALYRDALSADFPDVHVVVGPLGLHHMRNFIAAFFDEGVEILQMDDDIEDLLVMHEDASVEDVKSCKRYPLHPVPPEGMREWLFHAFDLLKHKSASLFGIYPVRNGYFMKDLPAITFDLRFCVGAFWGTINRRDIQLCLEEKEDFERTLQAFRRDGTVVRFNHVCPKTSYYKTKGGMQSRNVDRKEASKASCVYLLENWSQYCKLHTSKKNGMHEVRLRPTG